MSSRLINVFMSGAVGKMLVGKYRRMNKTGKGSER